jgi:hypothetical protein
MKSIKKLPPLVEIHWGDAWGAGGWKEVRTAECSSLKCVSIGYLIRRTEEGYVIAGTLDLENLDHTQPFSLGTIGHTMFRPRGMVTKIKVLRK